MAEATWVRLAALWTLSAAVLAGCGGSSVGDQDEPQPEAIAVVIGQSFTSTSSGVQTKVRSGAEVMLSGKESRKGEDDAGLPIITFQWQQTNATPPVQLVERSSNTVSFTAPRVMTPTTLTFRLTVGDAKGQTDTTDVSVQIEPIRDPDRFLEYMEASDQFEVVAATSAAIPADAASSATDVIPFTVTMTKLVTFTDRDRVARENVAVGEPVIFRGQWERRAGSGNTCDAVQNPRIHLQVPRLDLDDVIAGGNVLLSDRMEASDVDSATVSARIEISTSVALPAGVTPTMCVNALPATGASTPVGSSVERAVESLTGAGGRHDDRATAQAYYDTIDPATGALKKDTLRKWLGANGFNPTADGYGADTHAVYVNNYDLGFGRDMYMKQGACDTGTASLPLSQRAGHCDMAFVVVNYASLENAARRISPILAVAMEYSAASPGGERFTKFYTFAPDRRDGEFKRVLSANLDNRGEKYMPQACVTCHGGVPGQVDGTGAYSNNGNVHAGFLSWDLDALLFSDTDPSFTQKTRYVSLRNSYTRASQEAPLKALNAYAYMTLRDPQALPGRFALARELLEGWYGGRDLPNATFNSSFTPAGWQVAGLDGVAGTGDDNPSAAPTIYREVFGPHCRACHVYQIPNAADPRVAALCNNDATDDSSVSVSSPDQLPIACYRQLVAAPLLSEVLNDGRMPLARLTLDRLWTPPATGNSPGQRLAAHLAEVGVTVAAPGSQGPCIDPFGTEVQQNGATKHQVARGEVIRLTTECSHVLSGEQWSLQSPTSSRAVLAGGNTTSPAFTADRQGDYVVTLRDATGGSATITAMIPAEAPTVGSGSRNVVLSGTDPASIDINVTALTGFRAPDAIASLEVLTQNGVTATVLDPTNLRLSTAALAGGTATYRVTDIDGEVSNIGTITLSVSAAIAANDATVDSPANGGVTVDLATLVSVPAGQTFSLTINQQPTRNRGRGTGSASAPISGQTSYVAPLGVLSHFGGTQVDATDSFEYRACFVAQPATCDTGTITVRLNGSRSFASVRTAINQSSCESCHTTTRTGAAIVIHGGLISKQLYCNIRTGESITGDTGTEVAGTDYVDVASPALSLIYRKPNNQDAHGGGGFATVAAAILAWLDEGAYFTEEASQTCPP